MFLCLRPHFLCDQYAGGGFTFKLAQALLGAALAGDSLSDALTAWGYAYTVVLANTMNRSSSTTRAYMTTRSFETMHD
eukprot:COSAG05_NODE_472_length_9495_cov_29.989783_11_plen_78_part_00